MSRLALAFSFLTLSALPALAESFTVDCASNSPGPYPNSMFCNEGKMILFTPPDPGAEMMLEIKAPAEHCSLITYIVQRFDASEPVAIIEKLKPGKSKVVSLGKNWADGENAISISAVGHVGGCNTGTLGSWGAEATVTPGS